MSKDWDKWKASMGDEKTSADKNGTWDVVNRTSEAKSNVLNGFTSTNREFQELRILDTSLDWSPRVSHKWKESTTTRYLLQLLNMYPYGYCC